MAGFRRFLMRGNVVDLAVAVVIGAAFGGVVTSVVTGLITPLIGIPGRADFSTLSFSVNGSVFHYGLVINAVISFLTVAAVVYFAVVQPMNRIQERRAGTAVDKATKTCPECLSDIPGAARRCAFCTVELSA